MTPEDKIKVLAELGGFQFHTVRPNERAIASGYALYVGEQSLCFAPAYLTSYDAIIPLIQKQPHDVRIEMQEVMMSGFWCAAIQHTPDELADALIKAVGKWKD